MGVDAKKQRADNIDCKDIEDLAAAEKLTTVEFLNKIAENPTDENILIEISNSIQHKWNTLLRQIRIIRVGKGKNISNESAEAVGSDAINKRKKQTETDKLFTAASEKERKDDRWQEMNEYIDTQNLDVYSYGISDGDYDYGSSTGYEQKDYDHRTADKGIDWMNSVINDSEPFFLYFNFQSTHRPYARPKGYDEFRPDEYRIPRIRTKAIEKNKHDNSLKYVDEQIGKIVSFLEENGLKEDTVIAITSDHGHDLEDRHDFGAHGLTIYDEELLVPAIIYLPGVPHHNAISKVSHIDFVPTIVDLFGYEIPNEFQGDIMKFNRSIYFVTQSHKYKIGMIDRDIKVILNMNTDQVEVYNLREDPNELNNINSKEYNPYILKLLFWKFCQVDYYEKEKWSKETIDRCSKHNNFKI